MAFIRVKRHREVAVRGLWGIVVVATVLVAACDPLSGDLLLVVNDCDVDVVVVVRGVLGPVGTDGRVVRAGRAWGVYVDAVPTEPVTEPNPVFRTPELRR